MENLMINPLASTFTEGLAEMKKGLEKVKSSEKLFESDPWIWDWITIISERIKILETAASHELNMDSNG